MQPTPTYRIVRSGTKKLVGMRQIMSLTQPQTQILWQRFMPRRHEIGHPLNRDLISMQLYTPDYFESFQPDREFQKIACIEVEKVDTVPEGMENLTLDDGLYAVFHYRGPGNDPAVFQYIFGLWLPASDYVLDHRPHFEVLGAKYKNNDPNSEEEIWIPVRLK